MSPPVLTPVDTITLLIGTDQIECNCAGHALVDADPSSGTITRNGCGDPVVTPPDTVEQGTLQITMWPDRTTDAFVAWTWAHAGESAAFTFTVVSDGTDDTPDAAALKWAGDLIVRGVDETQTAYGKVETVQVTFSVTKWTSRAVAATP